VRASGVEAAVEFRLLKNREVEFLPVKDIMQTLALYKSLRETTLQQPYRHCNSRVVGSV